MNYIDNEVLIKDFKTVIKVPSLRAELFHKIEEYKGYNAEEIEKYRELENLIDPVEKKVKQIYPKCPVQQLPRNNWGESSQHKLFFGWLEGEGRRAIILPIFSLSFPLAFFPGDFLSGEFFPPGTEYLAWITRRCYEMSKNAEKGKNDVSRRKFRLKMPFLPFSAQKSGRGHPCL